MATVIVRVCGAFGRTMSGAETVFVCLRPKRTAEVNFGLCNGRGCMQMDNFAPVQVQRPSGVTGDAAGNSTAKLPF